MSESLRPLASRPSARVVESLKGFSDAALEAATAGTNVFLDAHWLRMLEALDLSALCLGEVALRFVVVTSGDELLAVCPFLITRSPSIVTGYSLERFYFTSWKEALSRINPDSAGWAVWAVRFAEAYRRFARLLRTGSEGWVLVVSPLSFHGGVACRPLPPEDQRRVLAAAMDALADVSRAENLPLNVYGIAEDRPIRGVLRELGFEERFFTYENAIDLGFRSFDEYLAQFPGKTRRHHVYEMRDAEEAGYRFELRRDFGALAEELEALFNTTYAKYGKDHFRQPVSFWRELERHLGASGRAEAVVAKRGGAVEGFSLLLHKGEEMSVFRVGRQALPDGTEPPVYFSLVMYEPVKRALELGVKRLWLGQGVWNVKRRRGARGVAIYNYYRFPTRRSRVVLGSFIKLYSNISRNQLDRLVAKDKQPEALPAPAAPIDPAAEAERLAKAEARRQEKKARAKAKKQERKAKERAEKQQEAQALPAEKGAEPAAPAEAEVKALVPEAPGAPGPDAAEEVAPKPASVAGK